MRVGTLSAEKTSDFYHLGDRVVQQEPCDRVCLFGFLFVCVCVWLWSMGRYMACFTFLKRNT